MMIEVNQLKKGDTFIYLDDTWTVIECERYFKAVNKAGKRDMLHISISSQTFKVELIC